MIEAIDKVRQQISKLLNRIAELNHALKKKDEVHIEYLEELALKIIERKDMLEIAENPTDDVRAEMEHLDSLLEELGVTALASPLDTLADFIEIIGTRKAPRRSNGVVLEVIKKGYLRNDELMRPTHVIITKND